MTAEQVQQMTGIRESYELPGRLMEIYKDQAKTEELFDKYMTLVEPDLRVDSFTDYFQESHSNRENMMQDFTPPSLTRLIGMMAGNPKRVLDLCAGTGGLTIAVWDGNRGAHFEAVELSTRALPVLLFNLAVRNMNATVYCEDVLTMEHPDGEGPYQFKLVPQERYSVIVPEPFTGFQLMELQPDLVVMNPPFSLKHKWNEKIADPRFAGYGYTPLQYSDLAFVLTGWHYLQDDGQMLAILPHGVLFRGNREGIIRQKLVEEKTLSSVIGLPEKLFHNTDIPVAILEFRKDSPGVLFIDASKECARDGKWNIMTASNLERIHCAWILRETVEKFSHLADLKEIQGNDFNLNLSRFVDTWEPEPLPDPVENVRAYHKAKRRIDELETQIHEMLKDLTANDEETAAQLAEVLKAWEDLLDDHPDR